MLQRAGYGPTGLQRHGRNVYELGFFAVLLAVAAVDLPQLSFDSPQYIALAEGRFADVVAPFSNRILAPALSALLSSNLGWSLAEGFSAVALVGAVLFLLAVHAVYRRYELEPYLLLPAVLAVPWVVGTIRDAYLPDILVLGLSAVFLLCVREDNWPLAGLVAALLILARETSAILIVLVLGFALHQRRHMLAAAVAVLTIGAFFFLRHLTPPAANVHAMNGLLYMALKLPVNLLRNVLGVQFWLNDFAWCPQPLFAVPMGGELGAYLGKIREIGVCAPNPMFPLGSAALALSTFGVLPGMTLALLRRRRGEWGKDPWLLLVVLYGALMFVLGLCTGASVYRLLTYGWPLFIFGTPILWKMSREGGPFDRRSLLAAQLGLSWLGPALGWAVGNAEWWQDAAAASAAALFGLLLNGWAYQLARAKRLPAAV
jgi:hypothetical protein